MATPENDARPLEAADASDKPRRGRMRSITEAAAAGGLGA